MKHSVKPDSLKKPNDEKLFQDKKPKDILEVVQNIFIDRTKMKLTEEKLSLKLSFEVSKKIQIEGASAENSSEIFKASNTPSNVEKSWKKPFKNALKKTNFKKKLEATNLRGKITKFFKPTSGGRFRVSAVGNLVECAIPGPNMKQSNSGWGTDQNTKFVTDQSGEFLEKKFGSHDSFEGGVTWDWTEGAGGTQHGPIRTGVIEFSEFLDRTVRDSTNGSAEDEGWPRGSLFCSE